MSLTFRSHFLLSIFATSSFKSDIIIELVSHCKREREKPAEVQYLMYSKYKILKIEKASENVACNTFYLDFKTSHLLPWRG